MTSAVSQGTTPVGRRRQAWAPLAGVAAIYTALMLVGLSDPVRLLFPALAAGTGIFGLLALAFSVRAATRRTLAPTARRAWWVFSSGILLLNLIPFTFATSGNVDTEGADVPILGDVLRLVAAVPLLAAMLTFPRSHTTRRDGHKLLLDVVTVVGGSFMVLWYFVLGPVVTSHQPLLTMVVATAYPITDLALIFGATVVVLRGAHVATRRPMVVLLFGLLMLVASDTSLGYSKLHPVSDAVQEVQLGVTMTGLFLFTLAGAEQCRLATDIRLAQGRTTSGAASRLPFAALAAGFVLLIAVSLRSGLYPWFGLICGAVVMTAAVAARQFIAMSENQRLLISDSLTGLVNRVRLREGLSDAVQRANRTGRRAAVLLIDMNGFKQINDTLGHDAGDQLLIGFARLLKANVLGADIVARLGGDEFAIVLRDVGSPDNAAAVAARIIAGMREPVAVNGEPVLASASIGIAITDPADPIEPTELLHRADMAMYRAKAENRNGNTYRFHEPAGRHGAAGPTPKPAAA